MDGGGGLGPPLAAPGLGPGVATRFLDPPPRGTVCVAVVAVVFVAVVDDGGGDGGGDGAAGGEAPAGTGEENVCGPPDEEDFKGGPGTLEFVACCENMRVRTAGEGDGEVSGSLGGTVRAGRGASFGPGGGAIVGGGGALEEGEPGWVSVSVSMSRSMSKSCVVGSVGFR